MKKIIAMILVLLLTLTVLVACKNDDTPQDTQAPTDTTPAGETEETGINHDIVNGYENVNQYVEDAVELPQVGFAE